MFSQEITINSITFNKEELYKIVKKEIPRIIPFSTESVLFLKEWLQNKSCPENIFTTIRRSTYSIKEKLKYIFYSDEDIITKFIIEVVNLFTYLDVDIQSYIRSEVYIFINLCKKNENKLLLLDVLDLDPLFSGVENIEKYILSLCEWKNHPKKRLYAVAVCFELGINVDKDYDAAIKFHKQNWDENKFVPSLTRLALLNLLLSNLDKAGNLALKSWNSYNDPYGYYYLYLFYKNLADRTNHYGKIVNNMQVKIMRDFQKLKFD